MCMCASTHIQYMNLNAHSTELGLYMSELPGQSFTEKLRDLEDESFVTDIIR